jgi:hypothetical protein
VLIFPCFASGQRPAAGEGGADDRGVDQAAHAGHATLAHGLDAQLTDSEQRAEQIPHRARNLLLSQRLARKLLEAHREWLDELEAELGKPAPRNAGDTPRDH